MKSQKQIDSEINVKKARLEQLKTSPLFNEEETQSQIKSIEKELDALAKLKEVEE